MRAAALSLTAIRTAKKIARWKTAGSGRKASTHGAKRDLWPEGWQSPRSSKGGLRFKYVSRGQAEQALRKFEAVKQRLQQRHSSGNKDDSYQGNGGSARSRLDLGKYWG